MKRRAVAWTAAAAAVVAVAAGTAIARHGDGSDPADALGTTPATPSPGTSGTSGTGEILPHPGPDGLLWIGDWIGNGGAASGGASPSGQPVTVTLACRGDLPAKAKVVFSTASDDPVEFTVTCPPGATGTGSTTVRAAQAGSFEVGVTTSDPGLHWGLTVTQPDS
ncbi:hypothetical protein HUT16_05100 [Kitasatospora sp. NA04385]|uniref:hypothetical protein n=1 Tax=Kitasatospora sp. NA04385 TaxID=2742135 RepID=UPI0015922A31|nr:hypothetical protein [Kitasatospora sp. NA04385]QKW18524.1 hypothetical protein HUT16_05100 [Kitasatospora sp. NA04385]